MGHHLTKSSQSYLTDHPERKPGEVWNTNSDEENFEKIPYTTKRKGETAFDGNGNIVKDGFPVFVQIGEFIAYVYQNREDGSRFLVERGAADKKALTVKLADWLKG